MSARPAQAAPETRELASSAAAAGLAEHLRSSRDTDARSRSDQATAAAGLQRAEHDAAVARAAAAEVLAQAKTELAAAQDVTRNAVYEIETARRARFEPS